MRLKALPPNPDPGYIEGLTVYKTPLFSIPELEDSGRGDFEVAAVTNALGSRVPVFPSGDVKPVNYVETPVGLLATLETGRVFLDRVGFGKDAVDAPVVESVV
mgnify:FL=1